MHRYALFRGSPGARAPVTGPVGWRPAIRVLSVSPRSSTSGYVVIAAGDAFCAAFSRQRQCLTAATTVRGGPLPPERPEEFGS
ncbi:MAG: hypothetical protein ACI8Y4_004294 [Candidatus Poriferisodalaceae bacterium]|jgi:hypothetical protein